MDNLAGQVVRGYELGELIGVGGFGAVYRAYQPSVGREVAIKVILPEHANKPDFIRRFEIEAQIIARLEHIHIVPLYDYWRDPSGAYLVMRYLRGGSLRAEIRQRGAFSLEETARLVDQIAAALSVAHRAGVVHRDLKPDNVLLDEEGNAYLVDFGIAIQPEIGIEDPEDTISGSPHYIAPEQLSGESATLRSDLYALGILIYEMVSGTLPFAAETDIADLLRIKLYEAVPMLDLKVPLDVQTALNMVIQQATAIAMEDRFTDALSLSGALRRAVVGSRPVGAVHPEVAHKPDARFIAGHPIPQTVIGEATPTAAVALPAVSNPYKGLRAFQQSDADDFYGREALVDRLIARLAEDGPFSRFLAVVGPSGSGKSSVVRAGLLPALRKGDIPGSRSWFYAELIPGESPLQDLESSLLSVAVNPLDKALLKEPEGLARALDQILPPEGELVLLIDQFEELFTLAAPADRAHLLQMLHAAVDAPGSRIRVLITLRADFYDRPLLFPVFGEMIRARTEVVLPLRMDELHRAIVNPSRRVGVIFEDELVSAIIQDVGEQPGTLPLLQYALTELFDRREGRRLTLAVYETSGGVSGALARRAEVLYQELDPAGQDAARQLFLRLVTLGEGSDDTRHRVAQSELASLSGDHAALEGVIERFGRARLLTFDRDPQTRERTVEVAHEALIRTWDRFQEWLNASREELRTTRRLIAAAAEWRNAGRDPSFLAVGARLVQFESLLNEAKVALNEAERAYVLASLAERERLTQTELARQQRELTLAQESAAAAQKAARAQAAAAGRLRLLALVMGAALVLGIGLLFLAVSGYAQASLEADKRATQESIAVQKTIRSEAQRLAAEATLLTQANGDSTEIALVALHSIRLGFSPQGDAAVTGALSLTLPIQFYRGHEDGVTSAHFAPDGTWFVTTSHDGTARVWDAASGEVRFVLSGHEDSVVVVVISADGKRIATGGRDNTARVWDAATGTLLMTLDPHGGEVVGVAFSPDGRYLATSGADNYARLWELTSGGLIHTFIGHQDWQETVAFSPDGRLLATTGHDKTVRLWDVITGVQVRLLEGHTDWVYQVVFMPDGKGLVTTSYDRTARLWDVATGETLRVFDHGSPVYTADVSHDGTLLLTGGEDKTARLWSLQTGAQIRQYVGHSAPLYGVSFAFDGESFITASADRAVERWSVHPHVGVPTALPHPDEVWAVVFSPDGQYLLTSNNDGALRLWDWRAGVLLREFTGHTGASWNVAFSPDGQYIASGGDDRTARLWETTSGREIRQFIGHTSSVYGLAFSPDMRYLVTSSEDHTARLWDVQTGSEIRRYTGHTAALYMAAFSADGRHVLTAGTDFTARVFDTETGDTLLTLRHDDAVTNAIYTPDGRYILTGSLDKTARLWDAITGAEVRRFVGHANGLQFAQISPDGKLVITASSDRTARLWDAATGTELRRLSLHTAVVGSVAFSPDGAYVASASTDTDVRLWDVSIWTAAERLCAQLLRDLDAEERAQYGIAEDAVACPR